jgi:hypothetical protein
MSRRRQIDKVRASRDGHEFHEAWTARKAAQLLWPDSDLTAIAVEGPSPTDQAGASAATLEVADLTFYYGGPPTFEDAARTTIAQFKYSIADQNKDFRASNSKKTVKKFGATYLSFRRKYGVQAVEDRLDFQLVTNQPVSDAFLQAIEATANESTCNGDVKKQAKQFKTAAGLKGKHSRLSRGSSRSSDAPEACLKPRVYLPACLLIGQQLTTPLLQRASANCENWCAIRQDTQARTATSSGALMFWPLCRSVTRRTCCRANLPLLT